MAPEGAAGGVRTATMTEDGASLGMGRLLDWMTFESTSGQDARRKSRHLAPVKSPG